MGPIVHKRTAVVIAVLCTWGLALGNTLHAPVLSSGGTAHSSGQIFVVGTFAPGNAANASLVLYAGPVHGWISISAGVAGDIDQDGDVDLNDRNLFVQVLLGFNALPAHVAASDLNRDGIPDGRDVPLFVEAISP